MRVLIVKMSSMGDVIHTLPAITDAALAIPSIEFDWVVEKSFRDIPKWSRHVKQVIPIQLRQWRKNWRHTHRSEEYRDFIHALTAKPYDLIIDAQGLYKSAWVARKARGPIAGLNFKSAREGLVSLCYQKKYDVKKGQHAITRVRQLFAKALGYSVPSTVAQYGIDKSTLPPKPITIDSEYCVFLHGTTWPTKHYPESYWSELLSLCKEKKVLLPWGNDTERNRAKRLAQQHTNAVVLPQCSIAEVASLLADAKQVIAVDTGLGHLSAALGMPTISLYGSTNPTEIGTQGKNQIHLTAQFPCAPCKKRQCTYKQKSDVMPACFSTMQPKTVMSILRKKHEQGS